VTNTQSPTVGLIIVTYNSRRFFPRLREALEAQSAGFELYVVDNASASAERPCPEDFPGGARIIQLEENTGFAGANNRAAALVSAPFVALLNPDAFPDPTWLEELLAAAARWPNAAAFGSTQIAADAPDRYDGLGDCYSVWGLPWRGGHGWTRGATQLVEGEVFSPCAAAALYRTEAWRALGGFDEKLFCYCEDVDLGFRLRLAGYSCVQAPRAVVQHVNGGSAGQHSAFAAYHGARNRFWVYVKNMPVLPLLLTAPVHAAATLALLAAASLRGVGGPTLGGLVAGVRGLGWAWGQRQPAQAGATAMRLMAWAPWTLAARAPVVRMFEALNL
jgi:N-acetylglucosaminyl-diphospho-decaprenol L-rhamnosyltransferase